MGNIVYILGAGRSGSTLLDIILGNLDGFFSAGELNRYIKRAGVPHDVEYSGKKEFWAAFKEEFEKEFELDPYEDSLRKINSFEYHTSFFKEKLIKNRKYFEFYKKYNRIFFKVLFQQIDEDYIIDSSKYPMRGYYLNQIFPGKVSYIYLKRRPSDVIRSFRKKHVEQPSKSWVEANLYLGTVNYISQQVFKKLYKEGCDCVEITYNDLVENPTEVFELVGNNLQINTSKIIRKICSNEELQVGYLFDGNRLRRQNTIKIRKPSDKKNDVYKTVINYAHSFWWK